MATGNLAPVLRQRFFDSNGLPLAGGKLYTYQSGTTTPQVTYTASDIGTPNANPVVLDANGEANVWLDPTLSYKFILQNSSSVVQWTTDGVIGALTANAVSTSSLQDLSVTTPKVAALAITAPKLASDASVDGNRAVTTDHVRDSAITAPKVAAGAISRIKAASSLFKAPTVQKFLSGSGTYNLNYAFDITSGNATVGATYTNNGVTFTVYATVASATLVYMSGSGAPAASGTLTKTGGTGDSTLTFSLATAPVYIRNRMVGGGGGGGVWPSGGSSIGGGAGAYIDSIITSPAATYAYAVGTGGASDTDGVDTTFGTNTAGKGQSGNGHSGVGGAATLSLGNGVAMVGNGGQAAGNQNGLSNAANVGNNGGVGGSGFFGGGPRSSAGTNANGVAGTANSGSGGGGSNAGGATGGAGGSGIIIIDEHYQ